MGIKATICCPFCNRIWYREIKGGLNWVIIQKFSSLGNKKGMIETLKRLTPNDLAGKHVRDVILNAVFGWMALLQATIKLDIYDPAKWSFTTIFEMLKPIVRANEIKFKDGSAGLSYKANDAEWSKLALLGAKSYSYERKEET